MSADLDLTEEAARLVSYGLRPKLRPAASPDYRELLRRFRQDATLRAHCEAVGRGLGLLILGATDHGLVLGAEDDGPFAMRLADYRRQATTVADRMCHGLIQLAIAAWCFPTAQQLEERDTVAGVRVSVHRTVDYLVELCAQLKERSATDDAEADSPELEEAWRTILSRAETRATADGRRAANTLAGMVAHALETLENGGLLRRVSDDDGGTWQALGSYRMQVRELAAYDSFLLVRRAGDHARSEALASATEER